MKDIIKNQFINNIKYEINIQHKKDNMNNSIKII
jgi:hypothetical protein